MDINLYSLGYPVTSLGPGNRAVLWVAGCARRCLECISPEMQEPRAGKATPVEKLVRHLVRLAVDLDGVTISGGEPFDQAPPLAELLRALRIERPLWNVIVYSGYTLAEIRSDAAGWAGNNSPPTASLLDYVDILIDGPYRKEVPSPHPLMGSGNQVIHYLSERGEALRPAFEACHAQTPNVGLGRGSFHMLIGVTDAASREIAMKVLRDEMDAAPGLIGGGKPETCDT